MDTIYCKPTVKNIPEMQELVKQEVINGNIIERKSHEMATTIRSYIVAKENEKIVGFVALHIHTEQLAEVRSLIVDEQFRHKHIGKNLVQKAIEEAKTYGLEKILVLTYKRELFESFGFIEISKESIPETKIWADCIKCKHFPVCNEIALILDI
ncbi:MAG: N-acetyltransferase [Campylobacterales bacterium]|nr:N-acetyltransferase [Campylobacterales bacterium]